MAEKQWDNSNSGALFFQDVDEGSKRPSISGKITLSRDVLKELVGMLTDGKEPYIDVAGWNRTSKTGKEFISVVIKPPSAAEAYRKSKGGGSGSSKFVRSKKDDFDF